MSQINRELGELRSLLGEPRGGPENFRFCCPACIRRRGKPDTKYTLSVSGEMRGAQCFKCDWSTSWRGLLRFLGIRTSSAWTDSEWDEFERQFELWSEEDDEDEDPEEIPYPCPTYALRPGMKSWAYLTGRGLSAAQIKRYGLRVGSGRMRYAWRVFLPTLDLDGRLLHWTARAFGLLGRHPVKYLSPSIPRRKIVYGLPQTLEALRGGHREITICEGSISAISAGPAAVGLLGKRAMPEQVSILLGLSKQAGVPAKEVSFLVTGETGDPTGPKTRYRQRRKKGYGVRPCSAADFALELAEHLRRLGKRVKLLLLPEGEDSNSLAEKGEWEKIKESAVPYTERIDAMEVL